MDEDATSTKAVGERARRLREFRQGAQLIFDNAESLYKEAIALRAAGFRARAAFLHQISMEECAKVDMLGAWAMTMLMNADVDDAQIARAFRDHKAKNHSNAYLARVTDEERDARERGDWKGSGEAFDRFKKMFHSTVNATKNAALYVDFEGGKFTSPSEVIPEETVTALAALNEYFLSGCPLYLRLLDRLNNETELFEGHVKRFVQLAEELRPEFDRDPEKAMHQILEEMRKAYK